MRIDDLSTTQLRAVVDRRLLINYRVDPAAVRAILPAGMRPLLVDGSAVAGVCMIRLTGMAPAWTPARLGWRSENAAHRFAVEWDEGGAVRTGVYISQRHSASKLVVAAGGRIFPGIHRAARFETADSAERSTVSMYAPQVAVHAAVRLAPRLCSTLFRDLGDASAFFREGSVGWSPARSAGDLEGLELITESWHVDAADPIDVRSEYFDNLGADLDCVLVMRSMPVTWKRVGRRNFGADVRSEVDGKALPRA